VQAEKLVGLFQENIAKFHGTVAKEIIEAGPRQKG
jgi:hypothetical protein